MTLKSGAGVFVVPHAAVIYRGPSLLTGDPVVVVATGLDGRGNNPKTGPMVQTWIIRSDMPPMLAARRNMDDAICGDCKFRGRNGFGRTCYVTPWLAPNNVFKKLGVYREFSRAELRLAMWKQQVRIGAYGDPAAVPYDFWRVMLQNVSGWTGYTHQWKSCDPRLNGLLMASVDTEDEQRDASLLGWRTFRVRSAADQPLPNEIVCPASNEAGHRTTCQECNLCRGTANPAKSVVIVAHGQRAAFFKGRADLEA